VSRAGAVGCCILIIGPGTGWLTLAGYCSFGRGLHFALDDGTEHVRGMLLRVKGIV